ncbi:MAG TPA: carboxyl transferase domain-containing protein [Pelomicrobium sp.]|nr:carboxyl transferase domain-containing protein [Pelomicrobium sp.]
MAEDNRLSALGVDDRIARLFDQGSFARDGDVCGVVGGTARLDGRPVVAVAFDRTQQGGSIGRRESQRLAGAFRAAAERRVPLVLCVDSAGARLTEGIEALGAFRAMFRAGLDAKAQGVPMLSLLARNAFGGGSMVSFLGEPRVYSESTRLAMSGPGIVEALGGAGELNAGDKGQVEALMGGRARAAHGAAEGLVADDAAAFRAAAVDWVRSVGGGSAPDLAARHALLGERLAAAGVAPRPPLPNMNLPQALEERLDALLPEGYTANCTDGVLWGAARAGGAMFSIAGLVGGGQVGARACWELAEAVLRLEQADPRAVLVLMDASGHATRRFDESVILSAYIVHLAEVLHAVGSRRPLALLAMGQGAGGIVPCLASPARRAWALEDAHIRELPAAAVAVVLPGAAEETVTPAALTGAGVVERVLSAEEFARYAADIFD